MTPNEVREERRRLGLSQAQLAKRLGVRVGAISRWERGEMRPQRYLRLAFLGLRHEMAAEADLEHGVEQP